jgi:cell wall-associated NlpC family hydrolase
MPGMLRVRHARRLVVALLLAPLLVLGLPAETQAATATKTTTKTTAHAAAARTTVSRAHRAVRIAKRQIGDPYVYGAAGPGAFDCSGLIYYSTHRAGYRHVPRTSSAQGSFMRHIKRSAMRRGDFVFFTSGGGVYHVAMYLGRHNGQRIVLHSPHTGSHVKRDPIWTDSWFAGTLRRH